MIDRSASVTRLLAAAIPHFAERGYDGASLAEVADAVGIRKPSIYAHFASKDALFWTAFLDVISAETDAVRESFARERASAPPGSRYCASLLRRYPLSADLRFLLRTSYMPPTSLSERICEAHERYLAELRSHFLARLRAQLGQTGSITHQRRCADGYMGLVDSVQVKLVYTDAAQSRHRLRAMQHLLNAALAQPRRD